MSLPDARMLTLALALAAFTGALLCAALVWWLRRSTGLPTERRRLTPTVVASDTGAGRSVTLRDPELGLRGRPDYLIRERDDESGDKVVVPVEVKPSRHSRRLYESDAVQLGAYLLALRATHGARAARHGYVRYAERSFRVELTTALEARVREIVAAVRTGREAAVVHRSHEVPARCRNCPVREACDEKLA